MPQSQLDDIALPLVSELVSLLIVVKRIKGLTSGRLCRALSQVLPLPYGVRNPAVRNPAEPARICSRRTMGQSASSGIRAGRILSSVGRADAKTEPQDLVWLPPALQLNNAVFESICGIAASDDQARMVQTPSLDAAVEQTPAKPDKLTSFDKIGPSAVLAERRHKKKNKTSTFR